MFIIVCSNLYNTDYERKGWDGVHCHGGREMSLSYQRFLGKVLIMCFILEPIVMPFKQQRSDTLSGRRDSEFDVRKFQEMI